MEENTFEFIAQKFKKWEEESQELEKKRFEKLRETKEMFRDATQKFNENVDFYRLKIRQASQIITIYTDVMMNEDEILKPELKEKMQGIISYLDRCIPVLEQLKEKAELAPSENPEDNLIRKMVPKINTDIFQFSTEQQWNNFKNGNFLDLKIVIKQNTQLKKAVAVIDAICEKLNTGITLTEFEQYNVFSYKGKVLTAKQYSDARNKIHPNKLRHYFE